MKGRGFTLVELLAVIVILAVISLIATPMILGVVETSRQESAKLSAIGYIDAIEKKVALSDFENKVYNDKEDYVYDEIEVEIKGAKPTGGIYSLENGIVTTGVFCINGYEVSYSNNETEVHGGCTGEDLKLSGSVKLSSSSGNYTYPTGGTFEVIENISGGTLSCVTSDAEVATCSIAGTTVTVTPGTKEDSATLTIKSEGNSKYKEAQAAYVATTTAGLLSITANNYEDMYDGEAHGIIVECSGATIKYGTEEGNYTLDSSPTYSDVGEYTVYYQVTKSGYKTVTGSRNVIITSLSSENVTYTNSSVSSITNVKEALDYLNAKLK